MKQGPSVAINQIKTQWLCLDTNFYPTVMAGVTIMLCFVHWLRLWHFYMSWNHSLHRIWLSIWIGCLVPSLIEKWLVLFPRFLFSLVSMATAYIVVLWLSWRVFFKNWLASSDCDYDMVTAFSAGSWQGLCRRMCAAWFRSKTNIIIVVIRWPFLQLDILGHLTHIPLLILVDCMFSKPKRGKLKFIGINDACELLFHFVWEEFILCTLFEKCTCKIFEYLSEVPPIQW